MKRFTLTVLLLMMVSGFSYAQSATDLIRKMSGKLKSIPSIEVEFSFAAYNSDGEKEAFQQGQFDLQGQAFKIATFGFILICDGESKWIFDEDAGEVVIMKNDPTKSDISENPFALLTDVTQAFEIVGAPKKVKGENGALRMITLRPKDAKLNYSTVKIMLDTESSLPLSIEYLSDQNARYVADVESFKEVPPRPESYFFFNVDLFDDIVVTDLR